MGKATITGGGTNGLYTVSVDYGAAIRFQLMTPLQDRVGKLDIQIAGQEAIVGAAADKVAVAISAADVAISAYAQAQQEFPEQDHTGLAAAATAAVENVIRARGEDSKARIMLTFMKAERKQLQGRISALQSAVMTETRQAWCATLVDDATGDVATAEIPGEPQSILIAPDAPAWNLTQHGQLLAREVMSPEQVFWNAAVLPGWQKWMPTYRAGTITAIDADTDLADVVLDAAISSANGLNVNQAETISGVPVVYMTCNAGAFSNGDRCLVHFSGMSWEGPRVVGFIDNPKPCLLVCRGVGTQPVFAFINDAKGNAFFNAAFNVSVKINGGAEVGLVSHPITQDTSTFKLRVNSSFIDSSLDPPPVSVTFRIGEKPPDKYDAVLSVYIMPPFPPANNGARNIAEIIIRNGAAIVLNIAVTDGGWSGNANYRTAKAKWSGGFDYVTGYGLVERLEYTLVTDTP